MMRAVMFVLSTLQLLVAAFVALVGSFADGGSFGERLVVVFVHPLAAIGLFMLVLQPGLSGNVLRIITALLGLNVAADVLLAVLIAQGSVKGDWELPLALGAIPAIGLVYALARLRSRPV